MRIPVLLSVPHQEPLIESAKALREKRPRNLPMELAQGKMPAGAVLDTRFAAVPIGTGLGLISAAEADPDKSDRFIVRADIEAASLQDVPEQLNGSTVYADPAIAPFQPGGGAITCINSPPQKAHADVQRALDTAALAKKGLDGTDVAIAIVDTGINRTHLDAKLGFASRWDAANSWAPPGSATPPFNFPVDHGTMCAFDALIVAPNATLLDFPILSVAAPGAATMSGSIGVAMQAYSYLLSGWAVAFAPGGVWNYKGLVVSNSWGMYHTSWDLPAGHPGRYCDNPKHVFHLLMASLVASGADVVFAAGNCGTQCPDGRCKGVTKGCIMGSNAHPDVLTVAGCDIRNDRVGYSSQGPSIAGMAPQKPNITGYTHFLGSESFGAGSADGGTSAACPVVAGCIAAIRTKLHHTKKPPTALYKQLEATAAPGPGTAAGWNADYGHGIVQPLAAANSLGL